MRYVSTSPVNSSIEAMVVYWFELGFALLVSGVYVAFQVIPYGWSESSKIQGGAAIFVFLVCTFYLALVDDERKPKAGATHRVVFGAFCGLTIAAIYNSVTIGYVLGILVGGILGYTGVYWVKYVRI